MIASLRRIKYPSAPGTRGDARVYQGVRTVVTSRHIEVTYKRCYRLAIQ